MMFTVAEVAGYLRLSIRTVQRHARAGTMHFVKIGRQWLMPRHWLLHYMGFGRRDGMPTSPDEAWHPVGPGITQREEPTTWANRDTSAP